MVKRVKHPVATGSRPAKPALAYRSVLIVTYGRSGSTLLQGLLNSIPGCLVRGENFNMCYGLFQSYWSLIRSKSEQGWDVAMQPTNPWFGAPALSPELFLRDAGEMIRRQLLADVDPETVSCLGFKEIRYPGLGNRGEDLPKYLSFLERLFPETAFIFLTRDIASVIRSGWWQESNPADVTKHLTQFEQSVRKWSSGRSNFFHVDYSDLAGHSPRIAELFAFLGAPYDRAAADAVLRTKHSLWPTSDAPKAPAAARPSAMAAKPPAVAPIPESKSRKNGWLSVDVVDKSFARVLIIDPLPERPVPGALANIGGVVLPQENCPDDVRMYLRAGGESSDIQWRLPSPAVGRRFPDDPVAAAARFRISLPVSFPASELVCRATDGKEWVLARLTSSA